MTKKLFLNDTFILGLIFLNTILVFVEGYITYERNSFFLEVAESIITVLFLVEMVVKLQAYGVEGYFRSNWNTFDFILIVISIPAFMAFIFQLDLADLGFLLFFRVARVFRVFGFLRFIPNINQLVSGVKRALKTSVFVLFGFFLYIFIIGMLSFYLFQDSGSEYFTNPTVSLYSVFKIFTIEGWFDIPEAITANYSETGAFFTYLYFIFVVLTGGIFGLSLVNSIFVDAMVSDNTDELERKVDNLDEKVTQILAKIKDP